MRERCDVVIVPNIGFVVGSSKPTITPSEFFDREYLGAFVRRNLLMLCVNREC